MRIRQQLLCERDRSRCLLLPIRCPFSTRSFCLTTLPRNCLISVHRKQFFVWVAGSWHMSWSDWMSRWSLTTRCRIRLYCPKMFSESRRRRRTVRQGADSALNVWSIYRLLFISICSFSYAQTWQELWSARRSENRYVRKPWRWIIHLIYYTICPSCKEVCVWDQAFGICCLDLSRERQFHQLGNFTVFI